MDLPASPTSYPQKISREEINQLPLARYEGPIHLIRDPASWPAALAALRRETVAIGFDTETRPVFKKGESFPTALIQMATAEGVWLFQLSRLPSLDPLVDILADPALLKVGVALRDDFVKLRELADFQENGVVDLATMAQRLGLLNTGLRSLTAIFLGFRISKAAQVTNWGRPELSDAQIQYAATDAWASRQLFLKMTSLGASWVPNVEA